MENLKDITDRDLIQLIKSGKDFKIKSLKEIKYTNINLDKGLNGKTVEKAITITNIFNTLGELDSNTISFAIRRYNTITLNNLYESNVKLKNIEEVTIKPITKTEESLIRQEYLKAKENTTFNLIKMSINDGVELEQMPLDELNNYIDKKLNRYKEMRKQSEEIKHIKGKEDFLISKVMENELNMSLGEIKDLDTILNSGKGLGNELDNLIKGQKESTNEEIKKAIQTLENRIKEFTLSLKEGKAKVKEDYKDIIKSLKDLNNSFNSNKKDKDQHMESSKEHLKLQNKLSKKDIVLQLPIETAGEYNNINLIVPDINKGIDKDNMLFYFNINTENLGDVKVNLKVIKEQIYIEFETKKEEIILENKVLLEEGLNKLGYSLEKIEFNI